MTSSISLSSIRIPLAAQVNDPIAAIMQSDNADIDNISSRVESVYQSFVPQVQTAYTLLKNFTASTEFEQNSKMLLVALLLKQLEGVQHSSHAGISAITRKVSKLKNALAKEIEQEDEKLVFGLTSRGFNLEPLKDPSKIAAHKPQINLPQDVRAGLKFLETSSYSYRIKAQILLKYLEGAKKELTASSSDPAKTIEDLFLIYTKGHEILSDFTLRRTAYFILEDRMVLNDFIQLVPIIDHFGLIRAQAILEKNDNPQTILTQLVELFNKNLISELQKGEKIIDVLKKWSEHFIDQKHFPKKSDVFLKELVALYKSFLPQSAQHQIEILCLECLIVAADPEGIKTVNYLSSGLNSFEATCRAFGGVDLIHAKHKSKKKSKKSKDLSKKSKDLSAVDPLLHGGFLQALVHLKKTPPLAMPVHPFDFNHYIFPCMKDGTLKGEARAMIAEALYLHNARSFAAIPRTIYYEGSWLESPESNKQAAEAENLSLFVFFKVLEGATLQERTHILGQFLLIGRELAEKGDLLFSFYLYYSKVNSFSAVFKEEWEAVKKHSSYKKAVDFFERHFSTDNNSVALKQFMSGLQKSGVLIIPPSGVFTKEIEAVLQTPCQGWVIGDRLLRYQSAIRFMLLEQDQSAQEPNLFAEAASYPKMQDKELYAFAKDKLKASPKHSPEMSKEKN